MLNVFAPKTSKIIRVLAPHKPNSTEEIFSEHRQTQLPTVNVDEIKKHIKHYHVMGYGALGTLLAGDLIWIKRSLGVTSLSSY